jgi:hypothetical protein
LDLRLWAIGLFLSACAGQVPHLTPRFEGGRSLFITKCSGCHTLRLPQAYSAERWPGILDKMQKLAKITDEEREEILRYILAVKESEKP